MRLDGLLLRLDNCRILLGSRFFVAFEPAGPLSRPYTGYRYTSLTSDHSVLYFYLFHFLLSSLYGTYLLLFAQPDGRTSDDPPRHRGPAARRAPPPSTLEHRPVSAAAPPDPPRVPDGTARDRGARTLSV